jgi:exonuclease VII large subunit
MLIAGLCLAGTATYAGQQQNSSQQGSDDPVADAARKAREQKKNAPKPKKVYTDDDVRGAGPAPAPAQAPPSSGDAAAKENPSATAKGAQKQEDATQTEDPNGETAWRKRFKEQHNKIAKAEKELEILQRELDRGQTQYYTDPQKALMQQNSRADINATTAKINAKKQELDQLKQGLDDLEDQLRKSGGDPSWAR